MSNSSKNYPIVVINEQKICHGWLVVCEGTPTKMMNQEVKLPWHAGYCIFDPNHRTVCCYKHEPYHFTSMSNAVQRNSSLRLDGGRAAFMNHWRLMPNGRGHSMVGSNTVARSYLRPVQEHPTIRDHFHSISRMPNKFATVRAIPASYLANKKRSNTTPCATTRTAPKLYINTDATLIKPEKRVSFKDFIYLENNIQDEEPENEDKNGESNYFYYDNYSNYNPNSIHDKKLHRCDTNDTTLLERYISRDMKSSHSPRHFGASRRAVDPDMLTRKRLSRSCDHLNEHQFSPRLPPIRRRPTKHVKTMAGFMIAQDTDAIHDEDGPTPNTSDSLDRRGWSSVSSSNRTTLTASVHNNLMNGRMSSSSHNLSSTRHSGSNQNLNHLPTNAYGFPIQPTNHHSDASAPQRIANMLSRPFRSNPLKRTKSVSKMEKEANQGTLNRIDPNITNNYQTPPMPPTRRHMSTPAREGSLRACRSHESLLSSTASTHMIDLNEDARLHPVHPSVLDVPNCFRVANTYYACRTPLERAKWMENLRKTMNPRRDVQRRTENGLQIWILEAKGLPAKRKYYCELCLDKTLYARTSAKPRTDNVFWGEHFDFAMLPKIDEVCVSVYRESDSKKKKDRATLIGIVTITIDQLTSRNPVERWYTVNTTNDTSSRIASALGAKSSSQDQSALRIKARWQSVEVLPMKAYDDLIHMLSYSYLPLCEQLEPILAVRVKEDFATSLVRVMYKQKLAKEFLCDLIMKEVEQLDNDHLMFRGNSLATKAMESFMKLVADEYLQSTLGDFIRTALNCEDSCEVDPQKLGNVSNSVLEKNRAILMRFVEVAWTKILNNVHQFPSDLREVFSVLRCRLDAQNRGALADTLISSSIFLRFLCPAILSPSLFNIVSEYPSGSTARNLTLIAKTLQNLANFTKFGGKEHYMEFMNEFVEREWQRMKDFLMRISSGAPGIDKTVESVVDVGKELSLIVTYLDEAWSPLLQEKNANNKSLCDVKSILSDLAECKRRPDSAFAQHPPIVHQPSSDYENSPQPITMPRHENVPAYRSTPPAGQATIMGRSMSRPATHLMTSDDYVLSSAFHTPSITRQGARLIDDTGTSSSRTSDKTTSSGEIRDDTDSDTELRDERSRAMRNRKRLPRTDASPSSSQQASSGYFSNNPSSYSNSSSSSPVDRMAALSIANPVFGPGPSKTYTAIPAEPNQVYQKRPSPPPYDPEAHTYHYQPVYAVPPDCEVSPRTTISSTSSTTASSNRLSLPRTNPRASRNSTLLRPTVVDVPDDWERNSEYWHDHRNVDQHRQQQEIIEKQKKEIERLLRENEELKRSMNTNYVTVVPKAESKRSDSGASEDSYDSLSSLDRPTRKSIVVMPQ